MNDTTVKAMTALVLCAGFLALAVFGLVLSGDQNGGSLMSCVAVSSGLVCDPHHQGSTGPHHDVASYRAVTNSAHALYAALLSMLLALAVVAFAIASGLVAPRYRLAFAATLERASASAPSTARLRRWLSLFESSPGR